MKAQQRVVVGSVQSDPAVWLDRLAAIYESVVILSPAFSHLIAQYFHKFSDYLVSLCQTLCCEVHCDRLVHCGDWFNAPSCFITDVSHYSWRHIKGTAPAPVVHLCWSFFCHCTRCNSPTSTGRRGEGEEWVYCHDRHSGSLCLSLRRKV